jgi:hypothetical protein
MTINVRKATDKDASGIRAIAQARWISKDSKEATGLVEYNIPDEKKYKFRIARGHFFAAENTRPRQIIGFLDAYSDRIIKDIFPNDPLVRYIARIEKDRFVYENTCAILKEYEGTGLARKLFWAMRKEIDPECKAIWCTISHKPVMNARSVAYFRKLGFKLKEEHDEFGCTFGLYRLNL